MIAINKKLIPKYLLSLIFPLLLSTFSLTGIIWLQYSEIQTKNTKLSPAEYQDQEEEERQKLKFLSKTPTFGFNNLLADWLYLNFIQYFGDGDVREQVGYALVPNYFDQVVKQDPRFIDAILRLEVATSLFAGLPQQSVKLLDKTLRSIPRKFITNIPPYYLWRSKGNNELLFLGDIAATKKSYEKSIEWAEVYNDEDSKRIIGISQQSLQFLEKDPNSRGAQISAWVGVLANRPDAKTVKRVIQKIEALGGKVTRNSEGMLTVKIKN